MPQVMIQEHHQITLPKSIVQQAHIDTDDMLDVSFQNGYIMLKVLDIPQKEKQRTSIMDYAGITEGLYGNSIEEFQSYVDDVRSDRTLAWD